MSGSEHDTATRQGVPIIARGVGPEALEAIGATGAILLLDKPSGWTSFDVVAKSRGILRTRKIGHTGTLDPMATGLLILCVGRATKMVESIQAEEKEYIGRMKFGATTPTDDAESEESETFPVDHLTEESIREGAAGFLGESMQRAPIFSARKVGGERLYKIARRGESVEIPAKPIVVREFEIPEVELPYARFRIVCSKGTYIRSLARDLGERLGSGAYLTELRRTRSGSFHVDDALRLDELQHLLRAGVSDPS